MRRALPALVLASVLAATTAGCELTSVELADAADVVVAEVYLRAGAGDPVQQAFLHRTVADPHGSLRVDHATIRVRRADGRTLRFEPAPASGCRSTADMDGHADPAVGPGADPGAGGDAGGDADFDLAGSCYLAHEPGFVLPGTAYQLAIDLADGRRIQGQATVPAAFQVVSPAAPACVLEGTSLELVWTRSAGAWAYQADARFTGLAEGLAARGVVDPPDTLRLLGLAVGANDTTLSFPQEFGIFDRFQVDIEVLRALQDGLPTGARADLMVAAGDRNYVNWVRGGNFNPSGQVRISSLTGDGVGVFGALVIRALEVGAPGGDGGASGWPVCE
jgi:hypothetical protein